MLERERNLGQEPGSPAGGKKEIAVALTRRKFHRPLLAGFGCFPEVLAAYSLGGFSIQYCGLSSDGTPSVQRRNYQRR